MINHSHKKTFLAIDLGATSGRAILGTLGNGKISLNELSRFPNPIIEINGRAYWDYFFLYNEIIKSLKIAKTQKQDIQSIGIDTWGVDFVCFGEDGEPLRMPYSYRDVRTAGAPERFFKKMPQKALYEKTGIQIMNFNSLFQLATMKEENNSIYSCIGKIVFMPDALSYALTGKMVTEYTIASTSQLLNPFTKQLDDVLLGMLDLKKTHFADIVFPGTIIGNISKSVEKQTGLKDIPVVAVAGHDTASAVVSVPAKNKNFAYLSSGTWSLMGIEAAQPVVNEETFSLNFTNEGGAGGSIRLLKNICGMWLIEKCRKEWEEESDVAYAALIEAAKNAAPFKCFINPDAPAFANPESMIKAIQNYCSNTHQNIPETKGEIVRCIFESLALRYRQVLADLQKLATFPIEVLHIIGGGAQNEMLNTFTANAIGIRVVAGPSEATALGNLLIQAKAAGSVSDIDQIREIVRASVELVTYNPQETEIWNEQFNNYLKIKN